MNKTHPLTVVDIFSGAGGLSEGFKQAGFEIILGVDNDPYAVKTFQMHQGKAILESVQNLTAPKIRKEIGNRKITVLAAGPPCQAFSTVAVAKLRSLKKSTTRRHPLNRLYKEFLRLVKELNPPFFVMENVGRMFSIGNGVIKDEIEHELKRKYNVTFYDENVRDFGVPQSRRRGVVIGNRLGLENPVLVHTHYNPEKKKNAPRMKQYETVRSGISDLPRISAGGGKEFMEYPSAKTLSNYQKKRRRGSKGVYNNTARTHSERDKKIFSMLRPGEWIDDLPYRFNPYRKDIFIDKYKKQLWDEPSSTILAHLSKDGLMFIHPDGWQRRSFTPREAARLQSFDDRYIFEGARGKQFIQIGNAVPPIFANSIAKSIKNVLVEKVFSRKLIRS